MYNLVELFSGIGSQSKALHNLGVEVNTIGTCEWDIQAFCAYDAIHNSTTILDEYKEKSKSDLLKLLSSYTLSNNGKEAMDKNTLAQYSKDILAKICTAIKRCKNFVDINTLTGEKIPDNIDILTYSFPCQDLSNVGAFHGYNKGIDKNSGSRSSLLWQVGRILSEMKESNKSLPRYLLMENVPTLLSPRHKPNFEEWINTLKELGYENHYYHRHIHRRLRKHPEPVSWIHEGGSGTSDPDPDTGRLKSRLSPPCGDSKLRSSLYQPDESQHRTVSGGSDHRRISGRQSGAWISDHLRKPGL